MAVGIDGGISTGNRILGSLSDMEDRSMYCAIIGDKKLWLPQFAIEKHFSNQQNMSYSAHLKYPTV